MELKVRRRQWFCYYDFIIIVYAAHKVFTTIGERVCVSTVPLSLSHSLSFPRILVFINADLIFISTMPLFT